MIYNPHTYQIRATDFILSHPYCALFLDMGLGKSVITLTALDKLMNDYLDIKHVLVIAPKSVALNTWASEARKWDHLHGLRVAVAVGSEKERRRAFDSDADIYVTNRDNVCTLVDSYYAPSGTPVNGGWPYDCVVIDESSSFKSRTSKRFKALMRMRSMIRRMILLTGTPAPNGLMDLWAQMRLLDDGARLGKYIGRYRDTYFRPGSRNGSVVYDYIPIPDARRLISDKISDICLSMSASDYLELPPILDGGGLMDFDDIEAYRKFERDCLMVLPDGSQIEAVSAVALTNKLLQYASGAVYDDEHTWHEVSNCKLCALDDLIAENTENILIYYNYIHELERMRARHPEIVTFRGEPDILNRWNSGDIRVMAAHPASVAYGLNMQTGGHIIVWYSPTWNLELYQQANARLLRQGQSRPVVIVHLVCRGTMDEVVMSALKGKDSMQDSLLRYLADARGKI